MAQPTMTAPLPLLLDLNGNGLSGGSVYIGIAGSDPQTFPQTCYWDAAGTIPASQPIATQSGYFVNAGNVAQLFGPTNYSIRVLDSNGVLVFYQPTVSNALAGPLALSANGLTVGATQLVCSGGFVGFGTASPGSAVDVAGTLRVTNPAVSTQYYALGLTGGVLTATPSAGVTSFKVLATTFDVWNAAGSTQIAQVNVSGLQIYGGIFDATGDVRTITQNAQSGNYTLAASDSGKSIRCTNAGAQTVTIPLNATVPFPIGTCITLVNTGTTAVSVAIAGGVTLTQAATGATGARTLATTGLCSLLKIATDSWYITGSGLS